MTNSNTNFLTLDKVLENTIKSEVEAVEFYHVMQSLVTKSEVLGLLKLLEKEEKQHVKVLTRYKTNCSCGNSYVQFTGDAAASLPTYDECKELTIKEILVKLIDAEEKTAAYYRKLSEFLTGDGKELFNGLAIFEESHSTKLKQLLLY